MMNRYKNKVVYNSADGTLKGAKNAMTMSEDYWLARREASPSPRCSSLYPSSYLRRDQVPKAPGFTAEVVILLIPCINGL